MENPLTVARFGVAIDGKVAEGSFTGVQGITYGNEVVESRVTSQGGQLLTIKKQPGNSYWTPITLTVAVTSSLDANAWLKETMDGGIEAARTDWSIIAYDQSESEVARWNLAAAWVSGISYSALDTAASDIQYEIWTVEHEGIERVS